MMTTKLSWRYLRLQNQEVSHTVIRTSSIFVNLKNPTLIQKGDISVKGHSNFKGNVLISAKAAEIPLHVEDGFGMNPAN